MTPPAPLPSRRSRASRAVGLAAVALAAACHPAAPKGPAAPPTDFMGGYAGQKRILRFQADRERVVVKRSDKAQLAGACDVAVEGRGAGLEEGPPRRLPETLGGPRVGEAAARR